MGKLLIIAVLMLVAGGNAVAADNGADNQVPSSPAPFGCMVRMVRTVHEFLF